MTESEKLDKLKNGYIAVECYIGFVHGVYVWRWDPYVLKVILTEQIGDIDPDKFDATHNLTEMPDDVIWVNKNTVSQ